MEIENDKARWLFADVLDDKPQTFQIAGFETQKSGKGKDIPVMLVTGAAGGFTGDFMLSLWNCVKEKVIEAWGTNSDDWEGKYVELTKSGDKVALNPVKKA